MGGSVRWQWSRRGVGHDISWLVGLVDRAGSWVDLGHREQGETDVAQGAQQAVQCRLVDDRALDQGGAVGLGGERHAVEARGPARGEMAGEADLVPTGLVGGTGGRVAHAGKLGADLVS